MNLNLNGISARLYRWFYATKTMPQTLCPYFWKLVIAYVLFIPWAIITLPTRIIEVHPDSGGEKLLFSLIIWVCVCMGLCGIFSITAFWEIYDEHTFLGKVQRTGIITLIIVAMVSLIIGIVYLVGHVKDRKQIKQLEYIWSKEGILVENPDYVAPKPNLVKEFVKAKYNKYCPKIDWK
jgi:hypothetical protein